MTDKEIIESLKFNVEEIARIISDAENVANDRLESTYTQECAKITAYNQIIEILQGE